jgi:hypothetical protein
VPNRKTLQTFLDIVLIHFLRFRLSNNVKVDFEHICDAEAILSIYQDGDQLLLAVLHNWVSGYGSRKARFYVLIAVFLLFGVLKDAGC